VSIRKFDKERIIINQGARGTKRIFIVLNGNIRTENGEILAKKGECMGSRFLKLEFKKACYETNVYVDKDTELGLVLYKDLRTFLEGDIEDIIK